MERRIVVRTPPAGRAALGGRLRLPAGGPTAFGDPRHVVVVEHRLEHGQQFLRRLPRDLKRLLATTHPHVAVLNANRLAGQTDQSFNEIGSGVGRGVAGKLEHDHVPPLRIGQLVDELAHQDPIAAVRGIARVLRIIGPQ